MNKQVKPITLPIGNQPQLRFEMSYHTVVKAVFTEYFGLQIVDNDLRFYTLITMLRNPHTGHFDTIESSHLSDLGLALKAFDLKMNKMN